MLFKKKNKNVMWCAPGSELLIDVAPGVDWTAAIAIVLGIQQVSIQAEFGIVDANPANRRKKIP